MLKNIASMIRGNLKPGKKNPKHIIPNMPLLKASATQTEIQIAAIRYSIVAISSLLL